MNSVAPAPNGAQISRNSKNDMAQIHVGNQSADPDPPPSYNITTQPQGAQYGAQYGAQPPITTQPMAQHPPGGQVPFGAQGQAQYGAQGFVITQAQYSGSMTVMAPGTVMIQPEVRWVQVEQVPGCQPCLSPLVALNSVIMQDESGFFIPDGNIKLREKIFKVLTPDGFAIFAGTLEHVLSSFKCSMTDQGGQEAIRVNAAFECCGGCLRCCKSDFNIEAPAGNSVGQMKQVFQFLGAGFSLQYHEGPTVDFSSYAVGPSATIRITQGNQEIGNIVGPALSPSSPNGFIGAACIQINFFGNVDVKVKAGIIAATSYFSANFFTIVRRRGGHRHRHVHGHAQRRRRRRRR